MSIHCNFFIIIVINFNEEKKKKAEKKRKNHLLLLSQILMKLQWLSQLFSLQLWVNSQAVWSL